MKHTKRCAGCSCTIHVSTRCQFYCRECRNAAYFAGNAARVIVRKAIFLGELPHPKTLACIDCLSPADCYDHRDYSKPLEVDPVCRSCNQKRGPANFFLPKNRVGKSLPANQPSADGEVLPPTRAQHGSISAVPVAAEFLEAV